MTMQKPTYTGEQIKRLSNVHRALCEARSIDPRSWQGRKIAELLLDKCTGNEPDHVILQRVSH